jgi:AAA family ATP:ADP antiporter
MLTKISACLFPGLTTKKNQQKFWALGWAFFFILGAYWIQRALKSTVIFTIAFPEEFNWPHATAKTFYLRLKTYVPWVIMLLVMIYSWYVLKLSKKRLLCILWSIYAFVFFLYAVFFFFFMHYPDQIGWLPLAIMGCTNFLIVESFGALAIPMFWALIDSITTTDSARKGFPLIYTLGHLGALIFTFLPYMQNKIYPLPSRNILFALMLISSIAIVFAVFILKKMPTEYQDQHIQTSSTSYPVKKTEQHWLKKLLSFFFTGPLLLLKKPYLLGVFIVSTFQEIIIQVIDIQINSTAVEIFGSKESMQFLNLQLQNGVLTQTLNLLLSALVLNSMLNCLKPGTILKSVPLISAGLFSGLFLFLIFGPADLTIQLYVLCLALILIRVLMYSVNNPCKEIMWIPIDKKIKLQAKGWVDSVGSRLIKSSAATLNRTSSQFTIYSTCILVLGIWASASVAVGNKNKKLLAKKEVIR